MIALLSTGLVVAQIPNSLSSTAQAAEEQLETCDQCHGHAEGAKSNSKARKTWPYDGLQALLPTCSATDFSKSKVIERVRELKMPPEGSGLEFDDEQRKTFLAVLKAWSSEKCPICPTSTEIGKIALEDARARGDRSIYFSVAHLCLEKSAKLLLTDPGATRRALNILLGHVTTASITPSVQDTPSPYLFRVDVSAMRWSVGTVEKLINADPLRSSFVTDSKERGPVVLRADAALRHLLQDGYYAALGIDDPESGLKLARGSTSAIAQFEEEPITRSGITKKFRIVRYESAPRPFWGTIDFISQTRPNHESEPANWLGWTAAAGGEFVGTLPNGLPLFLVFDGKASSLVQRVPRTIIEGDDSLLPESEHPVLTALSCLACHDDGLRNLSGELNGAISEQRQKFRAARHILTDGDDEHDARTAIAALLARQPNDSLPGELCRIAGLDEKPCSPDEFCSRRRVCATCREGFLARAMSAGKACISIEPVLTATVVPLRQPDRILFSSKCPEGGLIDDPIWVLDRDGSHLVELPNFERTQVACVRNSLSVGFVCSPAVSGRAVEVHCVLPEQAYARGRRTP